MKNNNEIVNKKKFLKLLHRPDSVKVTSISALEEMAQNYPYAQALHTLLAKAYKIHNPEHFEIKLNHAAAYAADRRNLKDIMEGKYSAPDKEYPFDEAGETSQDGQDLLLNEDLNRNVENELKVYIEKIEAEKKTLELQASESVSEEQKVENEKFIKELDIKIAEAQAKLLQAQGHPHPDRAKDEFYEESLAASEPAPHESNPALEASPANEDFYNELKENLENLQAHKNSMANSEKEASSNLSSNTIEPLSNNVEREKMEEYLSSLKTNKEHEIEDEKLREQIQIINKFIENEPKLSKLEKDEDDRVKREDLSLKSLKLDNTYASENLAMIMAKQGKLEKAEEIYNKLIWKFPEKKAYFAARIEDLKRK